MVNARRLAGVALVLGATLAACLGSLNLSSTSQAVVTVANDPYAFPGAGTTQFTVSAVGSSNDTIQSIAFESPTNCHDFSLDLSVDPAQTVPGARVCGTGATLAPSPGTCPISYFFNASFAPTISGTQSCNVDIATTTATGGTLNPVYVLHLSGTGSAAMYAMTVSPASANFSVPVGTTSSPVDVTVTNTGSTGLMLSGMLGPTSEYTLVAGSFTPHPLAPGASEIYSVTCTPPAQMTYMGAISFSTTTGQMGMTTLSCTGGPPSTVTITPNPVTFAPALVGGAPPDVQVTIGSSVLTTITEADVDMAAMAAGVSVVSISPPLNSSTMSTTVTLHYAAPTMFSGQLGTLTIKAASDSTNRQVTINGQALTGSIGTYPANVDLGPVCIGGSATKNLDVFANGMGTVELGSPTLRAGSPFTFSTTTSLPTALAGSHGNMVTFTTSIQSSAAMIGSASDTLTLNTNVPGMTMTPVALAAFVLAAGIAATPDLVHFGSVPVGMMSSGKQIVVTNCSSGSVMVTGARLTGSAPGDFTIVGPGEPRMTLAPSQSEAFTLQMTPHSQGTKTATLAIDYDGGTVTAALDGDSGSGGGTVDRQTYYACSTGRPITAWPIALALLALRRRRR